MKNKKGNTAVTTPIMLVTCMAVIITIFIYIINSIIPFIWYQKLQTIAIKYMYVIERFGYLTDNEYISLENDLVAMGFNKENIVISCPKSKQNYGELIKLQITCGLSSQGILGNKTIPLSITRYSYSKI